MNMLIFLVFLGIQSSAAVTHSLTYFYTASSGISTIPEYMSVGLVNNVQISHCDSITNRNVPKQQWMNKVSADDPDYWDEETQTCLDKQQTYKNNIQIAKQRFNQTEGVHIYQNMIGCEWDDETEDIRGYDQHGYDGEDLIALDLDTETWITPKYEVFTTKMKWSHETVGYEKKYFYRVCAEWLKKYVAYGRSSLLRTDLPSVSLLQMTSSSPVRCHATGFYPDRAKMFWRKDGEEVHEGVDKGEILPNNDGTFQMRVDLSSVPPEDWTMYECVFGFYGVSEELVTKLEKTRIRTNQGSSNMLIIPIIVAVVVLAIIAVIGFILYKKKNAKRPPSPVETSEVQEQMLPTA